MPMNVLRLIPEGGGETIKIDQDRALVGREATSDVHLQHASVSRLHAEIQRNFDDWTIIDRNSGNGVMVDGVRTDRSSLLPGQIVQFGTLSFRVDIDRGDDGATVILGRSPIAATDATLMAPSSIGGSLDLDYSAPPESEFEAPEPEPPPSPKPWILVAGVVVLLGFGALAFFVLSNRNRPASRPAPTPLPVALPSAPPPTPFPATPAPTPVPRPPERPRGILLISTDTSADVFVDGVRNGQVREGGMRRVQVTPGEHIVSFRIGPARYDRMVRVRAGEQAVVPFSLPVPTPSPSVVSPPASSPLPSVLPTLPFSTPPGTPSPTPKAIRGGRFKKTS